MSNGVARDQCAERQGDPHSYVTAIITEVVVAMNPYVRDRLRMKETRVGQS